jgi:hypothetical protein
MTLMERCRCRITKRPCSGNRHFEGLMDELVICDRDLTAEESQELIKNWDLGGHPGNTYNAAVPAQK